MKVGVLTFHLATNYGAVLQAYATCAMLKELGHEPVIIDYRTNGSLYEHYHKWDWTRCGLNGKNILKLRLNPKFAKFRRNFLTVDGKTLHSVEDLADRAAEFDAVVYGSDQIWNPEMFSGKMDAGFWAAGVPSTVRRIALSASFGGDCSAIAPYQSEVRKLAENFDAISVREKDALDVVDSEHHRGCLQLADPVFGLSSWDNLLEPVESAAGAVFEFAIQPRASFKQISALIADELKSDLVCADARIGFRQQRAKSLALSVGQWLWLIKNSKMVVTNSFHATVFCIIFKTPFVFVPLEGKHGQANPRNNRIFDLLKWSNLESRIWDADSSNSDLSRFVEMDDSLFTVANKEVLTRRLELHDYLKNHLV